MGILFAKGKKDGPAKEAVASNSGAPASTAERDVAAGSSRDSDAALDTLGAVLRAFGTSAFDVGELDASGVKRLFERCSQHALIAAPLDGETQSETPARRDWMGLRQVVASHRKREATYVETSLGNLREAIWSFVEIVNRAMAQDKEDGVLARDRLTSLRTALQGKDIQTLRREVSQTANALESALAEQQKRQQERLAEFALSVRSLGEQLESAKREGALDALTRLPNRASFDEFLGRTVKLAALVGGSFALMMVDVDQFKTINDTLGHQAGDAAIKAIADCLVRRFPRRGDLVARYGGDEFAVILRDTEPKDARALAQRLVESVRATTVSYNGRVVRVSCSIGLAPIEDGDSPDSWLSRADAALYQAKATGRDRFVESSPLPAPPPNPARPDTAAQPKTPHDAADTPRPAMTQKPVPNDGSTTPPLASQRAIPPALRIQRTESQKPVTNDLPAKPHSAPVRATPGSTTPGGAPAPRVRRP